MGTDRTTQTGMAARGGPQELTGREGDLRRLDDFLGSLDAVGSALVVCGEVGVGKTALLAAAVARAERAGVRTLAATGTQFEAQTGFGTLRHLLGPVLGELATLDPAHRDVLAVALGDDGEGSGPVPAAEAVARAVIGLLRRLTRDRPLLLVLDDLQWMDATSAMVLGLVARRLLGTRAGLLAAERADAASFFDRTGCSVHVLGPLDDAAADALLVARFPALAPRVRQRLRAEARGNPLALLELPVALAGSPHSTVDGALPAPLPLTRRLQAAFAARVTSLPAPTRYLLLLAALEGTGDLRLLQAAVADRCSLKHLGPAERAQLVRVDDAAGRLHFRHPLTRLAIVDLSTSDQRRSAHLALARPLADRPERRAWHLGQAALAPDEEVAAQLERAARSMSRHGDGTGAIASLLRAADLSPEPDRRARRLAEAAYLGVHVTGDLHQVPRLLDDARRSEPAGRGPGPLVAAVASSSYLLNGSGDIDTAHRLLSEAIDLHPAPYDPQDGTLTEALHTLMLVCFFGGRPELWQPVDAALAKFPPAPGILGITRSTFADPVRSTSRQLAALDAAVAELAFESDPVAIVRVGIAAAYVDRLDHCREALLRVAEGRHKGEAALAINALFLLGNRALRTGDWDELGQVTRDGLMLCEDHGYPMLAWVGRFLLAAKAANQGDLTASRSLTDEMERWAGPRRAWAVRRYAAHIRCLAALGQGDFDEAYRQAALVAPTGVPTMEPHALWVPLELVEAAVRSGRLEEARAHTRALRQAGVASLSPHLRMVVLAAEALTARGEAAERRYEQALAVPEGEQRPFEVARIHLCYGEHLRRTKAVVRARQHLALAADAFRRLGAHPWTARAEQELRATGGHRSGTGTLPGAPLTPQQHEIARLAAAGLTNREIGERLFLSPRTVSTHLYQLFPKLGISSRAALRDALDRLPLEQI